MRLLLIFLILGLSRRISPAHPPSLLIWNVGQGQWSTWSAESYCLHFDVGGEKAPSLESVCQGKRQILALSHSDWDHMNFITHLTRLGSHSCLIAPPAEIVENAKKRGLLGRLPVCGDPLPGLKELEVNEGAEPKPIRFRSRNRFSRVYVWRDRVLFPGDSPSTQERKWVSQVKPSVQLLLVGHHGSRSSTSEVLLNSLPQLKMTIVTARKSVYGHPHAEVILRIAKRKIPILKTEEWGNIQIQLD